MTENLTMKKKYETPAIDCLAIGTPWLCVASAADMAIDVIGGDKLIIDDGDVIL